MSLAHDPLALQLIQRGELTETSKGWFFSASLLPKGSLNRVYTL